MIPIRITAPRRVRVSPGRRRKLRRARRRAGSDVRHDQRAPFLSPLEQAQAAAYPAGEYVGQESFMRAGEVRTLARQARGGPRVSVLELCCGGAGPGPMSTEW